MAARNWGSVFVVSLSVLTPFFLDLDSRHFSVSMIAYGRSLLLTESRFPFSTLRLNQSDLVQIKRVGLASRSTRRWCRSGHCAKRARVNEQYLQFGLVNARSIFNKPHSIQDLIVSSRIDVLAVT